MSKSKFFSPDNWTIVKFFLKFLSKNSKNNLNNNNDRNINNRSFDSEKNRPKLRIDPPSPLRPSSSSSSSNKNNDQYINDGPSLGTLICKLILAIHFILFILLQFLWSSWCLWFQMNTMDPLFKMALFTTMTFIDSYLSYHVLLWLIILIKSMKKRTHQYLIERRRKRQLGRTPPELQTTLTTPMSALTLQSLSLVSNYFDVTPTPTPTIIIPTINVRLAQDQDDYDDETGFESIKFIDDSKSTMDMNSCLSFIKRKSSATSSISSIDMLANYLNQFDVSYLRKHSQDLTTGEKLTSSNESLATECSKSYRDSMP
ncbi:uncharacterized protein LOC124494453 [Dermatophagoides farinae]|uniref:uncharacterized protein LOC124494453 n=1 Tax=Dermatophagoides farinae TaxID=6954 RepID=UPI003F62E4E7